MFRDSFCRELLTDVLAELGAGAEGSGPRDRQQWGALVPLVGVPEPGAHLRDPTPGAYHPQRPIYRDPPPPGAHPQRPTTPRYPL